MTTLVDEEVQISKGSNNILLFLCSVLLTSLVLLLSANTIARYFFNTPLNWAEALSSVVFLWLVMAGAVLATIRSEHIRLTIFLDKLSAGGQALAQIFGYTLVVILTAVLLYPAAQYVLSEWPVTIPNLGMSNSFRVASIFIGLFLICIITFIYIFTENSSRNFAISIALILLLSIVFILARPLIEYIGNYNLIVFLVAIPILLLFLGVPIAFCFGLATLAYLVFATEIPLQVMIGRMDEGMSSAVLLSVPLFVLLGCILDETGMGKAIVDCLSSILGHIKAGMSYALLGSLFLVSGISGSKVADMATVAPALFPEMKRRGNKPSEMVALLGTGAAMADTVPPSIMLIIIGSVAGVSIADLFASGFVVAMVLLLVLVALARFRATNENTENVTRAPWSTIGRVLVVASPALILPFLIRGLVTEGVATATEVATLAVFYAVAISAIFYRRIGIKAFYRILVDTASTTGAIMIIMGAALAMAWCLSQSGFARDLAVIMKTIPGGWISFMAVTILVFIILGCFLEGLPAIVLLGPLMFPIAQGLGIHPIHYAMVVVVAVNIGLFIPPIGVGFYLACSIGRVSPEEALHGVWPYLLALLVGLIIISYVPIISIGIL